MLILSPKDPPKQYGISERDLILADALAYVEALEEKIVQRDLEKGKRNEPQRANGEQQESQAAPNA